MNAIESTSVTLDQWGDLFYIASSDKTFKRANYDCEYEDIRKWVNPTGCLKLQIEEDYMYKTEQITAVQLRANDIVLWRGMLRKVGSASLGQDKALHFILESGHTTCHVTFMTNTLVARIAHPVDVDKWLEENNVR